MTRLTLSCGAMLLACSLSAGAQRYHYSDRDAGTLDTSVAIDKNGTVDLRLPNGDIVVSSWNRDQVKVHASSETGGIRFNASPSRVTVETVYGRGHGSDSRFEITVPAGTQLRAQSQSGDITIRGTQAAVEATSQSGDLRLDDVGRIDVNSLSGSVEAHGVNGDASLRTVSGDLHLEDVKGDVDAETVSGDVQIRRAVARSVRAHSTSGELSYEGSIDASGRYELSSHSGNVSLTVPQTSGAQLSVSTWSGSIDSDFPITLQPGEHGMGKRFTFQIGNGAARITLDTFSGDVSINSSGTRPRGRPDDER